MKVSKAQLVEMLRSRGDHSLADRLNRELPNEVDSADHPDLFTLLELDLDADDANRHARPGEGETEDMGGLPTDDDGRRE